MLTTTYDPVPQVCRRAIVPACEPGIETIGTNPQSVDGQMMKLKAGDVIDVGIDWSQWLEANQGVKAASSFSAHAASPMAPTFSGAVNLFDDAKMHSIVVLDLTAATVGDTYYIENTLTVGPVLGGFAYPTRTVKRMISVRVIK